MLPPREGFSPDNAGAVAGVVRLLARPGDLVVGHDRTRTPFAGPLFVPVPDGGALFGSSLGRYARTVARALRPFRPSRIEVHNRPLVAACLARRFRGAQVSLHLHNDPRTMRGAATPGARRRLARRVAVAAVSAFLADAWCEGDARIRRPAVLPNPIALDALPPPSPPDRREPEVLFVGRIVADKGADLFVDAMAAVLPSAPGWRAAMIGADRFAADAPDTPFLAALRPRAAAAGVALHGFLPHAAVMRRLSRAAIVAVPSRWQEPFGLAALEAMAAGAALVAPGQGGLPADPGAAAIVVPAGDAAALARAIGRLVADPALRRARAADGLARAPLFDAALARARLDRFRAGGDAA